jgi:threonine/homoserine/homoserine lactone efflux protein
MGWDWLLALLFFEFASGFTPGPNNVLALAIGFSHGYRRTLPHVMGVAIGFPLMLLAIGFFLKPVMDRVPWLYDSLKYLSVAVVLWIAWKIASAPVEEELEEDEEIVRRPITFLQSVMLQWINPKAWAGALTIVTLYTLPEHYAISLFAAAFVTIFMTFSAVSLWALSGRYIKKLMRDPKKIRFFNILMAVLLLVSVGMMLF